MVKFRIGIDVDDVIVDLTGKIPIVVKELYGKDMTHPNLGCYDLYQFLGVTPDQADKFYRRLCDDFEDTFPIRGALEGMKELESRGHDITIVTNRWEKEATQEHLQRLGVGHYPQVFLKFDEPMVEVDYMLDDNPKKLAKLIPWIKGRAFLMDRPHNRFCLDVFDNFTRVISWREFMESIDFFERTIDREQN